MTDMPLIGAEAAALGLLLRALTTDDGERAMWPGRLLAGAIVLAVLPQLVVILVSPHHLAAGDPFSCGLPSQPACAVTAAAHPRLRSILQALLWLGPSGWLVLRALEETRVARLCALAAWGAAAFATMAKGPAGLVIPAAGAMVVVLHRGWRVLLRLEIVAGLALTLVMVGPWYLAVYARHGRGFLDELVLRHMLGRTLGHLHDTNDGEDVGLVYFLRQIGYATFPWCGLLPFAFAQTRSMGRRPVAIARALMFGAGLAAFALVSAMRTKFHHYMLITLPPFAALLGIWLAERRRGRWRVVVAIGSAAILYFVGRDLEATPARFILQLTYRYARTWPQAHVFGVFFALVTAAAVLAQRRALQIAIAGLTAAVLVDGYLPRCAADGGQRDLIKAYYEIRNTEESPSKNPLIAYQLNWKGENFYTGNNLAIFVRSGAPLRRYLDQQRARGERAFYFATERGRVAGLRRELGPHADVEELAQNAEFTLARATF